MSGDKTNRCGAKGIREVHTGDVHTASLCLLCRPAPNLLTKAALETYLMLRIRDHNLTSS